MTSSVTRGQKFLISYFHIGPIHFDVEKMGVLIKILRLIGPVIFICIVLKWIDVYSMLHTLKTASVEYIFLSYVFNMFVFFGKIYRIYYLFNKNEINVKFFYLTKIYTYSNFLGQVSNMIIADITNAGILMLNSEKKLRITNIFIATRAADLLMISVMFVTFFVLNYHYIDASVQVSLKSILLISLILLLAVCVILLFKSRFVVLLRDLMFILKSFFIEIFFLTILIYFCYSVAATNDAKAFGLNIPVSYLLMTYTIGSLITVLPVSVAGIGTRDIAFVFLMNLLKVSSEGAVAMSSAGFIVIPISALFTIFIISHIGARYEARHNS